MIGFLQGKVLEIGSQTLVLDVNGVGYEVVLDRHSLSGMGTLGAELGLTIRTVVREDAITLYGFLEPVGRDVFDLLVTVAGVGPRLASGVMGGMPLHELVYAVREKDLRVLTSISGVGKKLAERLALELSDKFLDLPVALPTEEGGPGAGQAEDVKSALMNLGFSARDAASAVRELKPEPDASLEDLIKQAIASMNA